VGDILQHNLEIRGSRYLPIDSSLIPSGDMLPVAGTPFDFRASTPIGERIGQDNAQLISGHGYDHNWILDKSPHEFALDAVVRDPSSGRVLEVWSTQPGIQFYSGNFLDGNLTGANGERIDVRGGFCLEPQHFPDSPNEPRFPSTLLKPGEVYRETIEYRVRREGFRGSS
jgi:aldose 1-epimerase